MSTEQEAVDVTKYTVEVPHWQGSYRSLATSIKMKWMKKRLAREGYGYISVIDMNRKERLYFTKLSYPRVRIGNRTFIINPKYAVTTPDGFVKYYYNVTHSYPIPMFPVDKDVKQTPQTDPEFLDHLLMKTYAEGMRKAVSGLLSNVNPMVILMIAIAFVIVFAVLTGGVK